jgi:Flp pilus assembly pilin Flp
VGSEWRTEEFKLRGEELLAKVKELVREGNVRRLIIKNEDGATLIEVPLTVGVLGAVLLPVWAAIGAIAALATDCTIVVERRVPGSDEGDEAGPAV